MLAPTPAVPTLDVPNASLMDAFAGRALSAAMPAGVNDVLLDHLLQHVRRGEEQEDLAFALWRPSVGASRATAMLHTVVLPRDGERGLHGNASFNPAYLERALDAAASGGMGVAFLHSHPGPGWQGMSRDDVTAESRTAGAVAALTDLPLVGLTAGTDGTWSARMWFHAGARRYDLRWCESVRVAGRRLRVSFDDRQVPPPAYRDAFRRTRTVWGDEGHRHLARLRVGIVGLGSVGMSVAEMLARSGVERFTLVDFDEVQAHNLDRLQGADNGADVGRRKVDVAEALIRRAATAAAVEVRRVAASVVEEAGYRPALDCDVLFSCVDRPRARQILNHIAYAHLIPVIDGGIAVRFREREGRPMFAGAEWQLQTVGPDHACLECLGAFSGSDADTERNGLLDDPSYMRGLPAEHRLRQSENVYPFSANLASLEVFQFAALAAGLPQLDAGAVQRFHLAAGLLDSDETRTCRDGCDVSALVATGDTHFTLTGHDHAAQKARERQHAGQVT